MAYTVSKALRQNPTPMWEAQLAPDTQTLSLLSLLDQELLRCLDGGVDVASGRADSDLSVTTIWTLKEKIRQQLYSYDPSINRGTVVVVEEPRPDPKPPILEGRDLDLD